MTTWTSHHRGQHFALNGTISHCVTFAEGKWWAYVDGRRLGFYLTREAAQQAVEHQVLELSA